MKKINLFAIGFLAAVSLAGCGDGDSSVAKAIEGLRKGFVAKGDIVEHAKYLDGYDGAYTGEEDEQDFTYEYVFENGEREGIQRQFNMVEDDDSLTSILSDTFIRGDDGKVYYTELTIENEVINTPAVTSAGATVNYDYYFGNPFHYVLPSDFTKVEGNTYTINKAKASFIATKMFDAFDIVFSEVITDVKCIIENGVMKSMELVPGEVMDYATVGVSNQYYILDAKATINFSEIGTAKIHTVEAKQHRDEHDAVRSALDKIQDNYTLTVNYTLEDDGDEPATLSSKYFFTEKGIFYKPNCSDMDNPDPLSDVALQIGNEGKLTAYGYNNATGNWTKAAAISNGLSVFNNFVVSDIKPVVSEVAAELFDYVASQNKYYICEELESFIGIEAFVPPLETITDSYLNGFGTLCTLELNENGELDTINVAYTIDNGFLYREVNFELVFENVGTTTLPYGITF